MSADGVPHIPDLLLEQYRLDELPPEDAAHVARCLQADPALRARLEELDGSDEEINRAYPADWLARQVRTRVSRGRDAAATGRLRRLALASAFSTIVVILLFPLLMISQAPEERVKGLEPGLALYRRTAQGSETLADGAVARAGDLVRIGYISAGRDYGVILSVDGRGIVTRHLPVEGTRAAALRKDGTVLLDAAYELDDAPAWERFYFVTADQPFDIAAIEQAARRAAAAAPRVPAALPLPRTFGQSTFSLQKEVKP